MNNKIIERIKKMFALANCEGAAPGEAENAMRMATKLMDKYNLSSVELHTSDDITIKFEDGTRSNWIRQVYLHIAPVFSCETFRSSENMFIVGTESDAITASIVIDNLITNIKRASKGKGDSFRKSAVYELGKTCKIIIEEKKEVKDKIPGTELVLFDIYSEKMSKNQEFLNKNFNLKVSKASSFYKNAEGAAYGATLNPNVNLSNKRALN